MQRAVRKIAERQAGLRVSNIYRSEGLGLEKGWLAELWSVVGFSVDSDLGEVQTLTSKLDEDSKLETTLLTFGDLVELNPSCPLPNPRLHRLRIFVQCAAEIEPSYIHPILGQSLLQLVNTDERGLTGEFFAQGRQVLK